MDMQIQLSPEEVDLLCAVLTEESESVREELFHTDNREYRDRVKHQSEMIDRLLQKTKETRVAFKGREA